ncbi:hypothetical protein [Alkalihalobacterium alkalinitrilicum]|uniref:hypothetical protein n=1 Tax=Alkalihalobacterium alkalinitrilicum TaxID=427920 RepID=UPI000995C5D7|nr:hypothetical protein [Alkalihalobacterium alkalinitrilicum]
MSQEVITYLQRLEQKIDEKYNQVNIKFNSMDEKFEQVDKRFDQVEKRLNSNEKMLAQLIELVTVTNQRLKHFETEAHKRFDTLESKVSRMESDTNLLFKESTETKRDIEKVLS